MISLFLSFLSLYTAILFLSLGTGLFNTYIALFLTQNNVSEVWVGLLMAAYYTGLVLGARTGHKLIVYVGHIRAYAIAAAIVAIMVLMQTIVSNITLWLFFRVVVGMAMVTQYMILESWLNDQSDSTTRGSIFSFYMIMSSLGLVLGQASISVFPSLDHTPLIVVAIATALCLIPVAMTRRVHPVIHSQAPIKFQVFIRLVPMSMFILFMAGCITGTFYSLAPVYGIKLGLDTNQIAMFLSVCVMAGVLFQWPMGWLSDRVDRVKLIGINVFLLTLVTIPLYGYWSVSFPLVLLLVAIVGILQFTIYPLAIAFANDHVEPGLRVGLSGVLLMVYGVGAGLGPVVAGKLMDVGGAGMFYIFTSACAFILTLFIRRQKVSGKYRVQQEPFVPMPVDIQPAPAVQDLDPRVDRSIDISADEAKMEEVIEQLKADEEQERLEQERLEQERLEAVVPAADGQDGAQREEVLLAEPAGDVAAETEILSDSKLRPAEP
ncbi:MAG: MFS transporter [Alcaligenaceae bacterium]|nr:MFS transporter [Alcaligenaceae bacterium]